MRALRYSFALLTLVVLLPVVCLAQVPSRSDEDRAIYRRTMEEADQKIAVEVKTHSELMKNLEYLTTQIGPRLTGSPQMNAASQWTLLRFRDYGVDAHLETTEIKHGWARGLDSAVIVAPIHRTIPIHAAGWSKNTNGILTAPVVLVRGNTAEELDQIKGNLKGAIVIRPPSTLPRDDEVWDNSYDALVRRKPHLPAQAGLSPNQVFDRIAAEQPSAYLIDSGKIDSLFTMDAFSEYEPTKIPMAMLTHEDHNLIYRLLQSGATVTMNVSITGTFTPGSVPTSITVAEIRGSERPAERVILGAHLDSWDLGQGALDNGTGAMAVLEAARTLKALGWTPKRTITFVLFTGEEQGGGTGVQTFLKNHESEIPHIDAVLIQDGGTGKCFSLALENLHETLPLASEIYLPLQEVFELQPMSLRSMIGSDHVAFLDRGVPAYICIQEPAHYREAHHSQADTFDKVIPEKVNETAAMMAAWAWNVSEMPEALPHHQDKR